MASFQSRKKDRSHFVLVSGGYVIGGDVKSEGMPDKVKFCAIEEYPGHKEMASYIKKHFDSEVSKGVQARVDTLMAEANKETASPSSG